MLFFSWGGGGGCKKYHQRKNNESPCHHRHLMSLSHRGMTMLWPWRPSEFTRSLFGCQLSEKCCLVWLQWGPCCTSTALWHASCWQITATFASSIVFPLQPLYQCGSQTTTSQHPSHMLNATIGNQNVTLQQCYHDLGDHTTLRPHNVHAATSVDSLCIWLHSTKKGYKLAFFLSTRP